VLDDWLSFRMGVRGARQVVLLVEYLLAPTWAESAAFLDRHPQLRDQELAELLASGASGAGRHEGDGGAGDLLIEGAYLLYLSASADPAEALAQLRPPAKPAVAPQALNFLLVNAMGQLRMAAVTALERFINTHDLEHLDAAVQAWRELLAHDALAVVPADVRLTTFGEAALTFWLAYAPAGDPAHLAVLVSVLREAVALAPRGSPELGDHLYGLAGALYLRHERLGDPADLDGAVDAYEQALTLVPRHGTRSDYVHEWDRATVLHDLGEAARRRFELRGDPADLDRALDAHQQALAAVREGTAAYAHYLGSVGLDLRMRYATGHGGAPDLDRAIDTLARAEVADSVADEVRARIRNNLGVALRDRYELTGDSADLDRATRLHRSLASAEAPFDVDNSQAAFLNNLALDLRAAYRGGDAAARDEALVVFRAAAEAADGAADHPAMAMDLAIGLIDRYRSDGHLDDLDEAVTLFDSVAAQTPWAAPLAARAVANLGLALELRYQVTGHGDDLEAAVAALRRAAGAPSAGLERVSHLGNLGIMLLEKYAVTGDPALLGEAIGVLTEARAGSPPAAPDRAWQLESLGQALLTRYRRTGDLGDLDRAVDVLQRAVDEAEPGNPSLPLVLNDLGVALTEWPRANGARLDTAVQLLEDAVRRLPAGSPDRPAVLTSFAAVLRRRGAAGDLFRAATALQEAVAATPDVSPGRALRVNQLARLWLDMSVAIGSANLLTRAIDLLENSVAEARPALTELPVLLNNLGDGYRQRYAASGDAAALDRARAAYGQAVTLGLSHRVEVALVTATSWGDWAGSRRDWPEAADAYLQGLAALEALLRAQLLRADKQIRLRRGIATSAAYAAAAAGDLSAAALATERGRAVLLSEALDLTRADLDALTRQGRDDVAARYSRAANHWLILSRAGEPAPLSPLRPTPVQ
jgi:hypothetical protein